MGESGCGKTTLGRIILGLEKPTDGNILFEGENIFSKKEVKKEMRKNMQMVFQDPYASLDPKMKVEEILMEPLLANKVYLSGSLCIFRSKDESGRNPDGTAFGK